MNIVATHPLEIGYHTSSVETQISSEFCGATTFSIQQDEVDHLVTLLIVARGFGSDSRDLRASHVAGMILRRHFSQSTSTDMVNLLGRALQDANQVIISRIKDSQDAEVDRGVALAVAVIFDHSLYVSNIGDCRIYLQRARDPLSQITFDHTVPDPQREEQDTTPLPDAAPRRYLGMSSEVQPDFRMRLDSEQRDDLMAENQGTELQPGDRLVIVTKAVTRALSTPQIERVLSRYRPQLAALQLTRMSLSHTDAQSASALIVQIPRSGVRTWPSPFRLIRRYGVWLLLFLVLIAGTVFGAGNIRSPLATATPPHFVVPSLTLTEEPPTAEPDIPTTTPTATRTREHAPVYTRPPLPSETPIHPSPTATASPTPTATTMPTATPRPTQVWLTYTPSPVFTPSDTPAPPPSNTQPSQPTNTPIPQPTNTEPPPPTDTPLPPPSATPRPTLTAPRPTLTPE